jgi:hypothetical protein
VPILLHYRGLQEQQQQLVSGGKYSPTTNS